MRYSNLFLPVRLYFQVSFVLVLYTMCSVSTGLPHESLSCSSDIPCQSFRARIFSPMSRPYFSIRALLRSMYLTNFTTIHIATPMTMRTIQPWSILYSRSIASEIANFDIKAGRPLPCAPHPRTCAGCASHSDRIVQEVPAYCFLDQLQARICDPTLGSCDCGLFLAVTSRHVELCVDVRQGSLCATIPNKLYGMLKSLSQDSSPQVLHP